MSNSPEREVGGDDNAEEADASGGARGWQKETSGISWRNKGEEPTSNSEGRWRSGARTTRFFGERSSSRNIQQEQWRGAGSANKFFGERSANKSSTTETNWRTSKSTTERPITDFRNKGTASISHKLEERKVNRPIPKEAVAFDVPSLLFEKLSNELVTFLVENLADFNDFLTSPLSPNTITQLVFVVEKVSSAKASKFANVILSRICKNLMSQLDLYLVKLSLDEEDDKKDNETFWMNPDVFWKTLVVLFENIINRLQASARKFLPKIMKACLITIEFHKNSHGIRVKEVLKQKLEYLINYLKNLREIAEYGEEHADDAFRNVDIYPSPSEILIRTRPYVRSNITQGRYRSVEHYLDTHFQLLREDFLAPLRDGVSAYKDYLENGEYVKITEFRVYTNAAFVEDITPFVKESVWRGRNSAIYHFGRIVRHRAFKMLYPGTCTQKYISGDESFMSGSLLCFSSDNFETIFFGAVVRLHDTKKGFVNVQLLQNVPFLYDRTFTMLECTNYFGTYYSVLKALQNFDTHKFPMERYILNVENSHEPPAYFNHTTRYTSGDSEFTVLNFESWPSKEEFGLNEMQYEAFKHALTSQFAVIQGPPGTGKTYLALKIAQTLIENHSEWDKNYSLHEFMLESDDEDDSDYTRLLQMLGLTTSSPILVVAYTNHALDQFLEGLLPFTKKIVRFGQQSKNDNISKLTFRGAALHHDILSDYYDDIQNALAKSRRKMEELESALSYCGIFNIRRFVRVIPGLENSPICHLSATEITKWLMGNSSTEQQRTERWEATKEFTDSIENLNNKKRTAKKPNYMSHYILTIASLERRSLQLEDQLAFKGAIELETIFKNWNRLENFYEQTCDDLAYLQWRLQNANAHVNLYEERQIAEDDFFELSYTDRWILYFHWLDLYIKHLRSVLKRNSSIVSDIWEQMEMQKQEKDGRGVSGAVVVGMTTSCAARYQHLLQILKCRTVIVEEAAEVLECHIIASLTGHCQHLILIGDHQQLRPSTADYRIEKQCQLGISLFERMVRNGIRCSTLEVQHRMRPEISALIAPSIYPNLKNHSSVSNFPNIGGIMHNVFFINHKHSEAQIGNSRRNSFEAAYIVALARHLILQGYKPDEITILTTYKGQMHEIEDHISKAPSNYLKDVRITVVDNFQGEENKIILLSLVRSNNESSIGFLAIENRVCVALSRAKQALYMIGNMNILTENSKIWPKVKEVLVKNNQLGQGLQLACQIHPENVLVAVTPEDFQKAPDGGCSLPCGENLKCRHKCRRKCHVTDVDHSEYCCMEPCTKILCMVDHVCPKKCWEECGSCRIPVERLLPCEHLEMVPCSMKTEEYKCSALVETLLKCGHLVQKPCFENLDEFKCPVEIEAIKPACGHTIKKRCHESFSKLMCRMRVTIHLMCGHEVEASCWYKEDSSTLNARCRKQCLKLLKCGHTCLKDCHYLTDPMHATKENSCNEKCLKLQIGCKTYHQCNLQCSEPCKPCLEDVKLDLPCGHSQTVKCCKSDKKYTCQKFCKKIKPCGHICYSKCHAVCNAACKFKVFKQFPKCGHAIKVDCSEDVDRKTCSKCSRKNVKKSGNI